MAIGTCRVPRGPPRLLVSLMRKSSWMPYQVWIKSCCTQRRETALPPFCNCLGSPRDILRRQGRRFTSSPIIHIPDRPQIKNGVADMRIAHYPPQPYSVPDGSIGLGAHSEYVIQIIYSMSLNEFTIPHSFLVGSHLLSISEYNRYLL